MELLAALFIILGIVLLFFSLYISFAIAVEDIYSKNSIKKARNIVKSSLGWGITFLLIGLSFYVVDKNFARAEKYSNSIIVETKN